VLEGEDLYNVYLIVRESEMVCSRVQTTMRWCTDYWTI